MRPVLWPLFFFDEDCNAWICDSAADLGELLEGRNDVEFTLYDRGGRNFHAEYLGRDGLPTKRDEGASLSIVAGELDAAGFADLARRFVILHVDAMPRVELPEEPAAVAAVLALTANVQGPKRRGVDSRRRRWTPRAGFP